MTVWVMSAIVGVVSLFALWASLKLGQVYGARLATKWVGQIERADQGEPLYPLRRGSPSSRGTCRVVMVAPFGLCKKMTVWSRIIPLADQLLKNGHEVTLIIPPWDCPEGSHEDHQIGDLKVLYAKNSLWRPRYADPVLLWRLWRRVLAERADILYCFKPIGYSGAVSLLAYASRKMHIWRRRLPRRIVVDTDDLEGSEGWGSRVERASVARAFAGFQERLVIRYCDAVTCASSPLTELVRQWHHNSEQVHRLPNGTSPYPWGEDMDWRPRGQAPYHIRRIETLVKSLNPSHTLLLYTRFSEFSSDRVVEILGQVERSCPGLVVLVVGDSHDGKSREQKQRLAMLARDHGLDPNRIVFTGWIRNEWVDDLIRLAEVAIYPVDDVHINKYKSYVRALEVMAHRVPIVGENVGDLGLHLDDDRGVLLPGGSSADRFAEEVVALLEAPKRQAAIAERAWRWATNEYSWDHVFKKAQATILGGEPSQGC